LILAKWSLVLQSYPL